MDTASLKCMPSALDLARRSEPAKSTKLRLVPVRAAPVSPAALELSRCTVKTVCDLDEPELAAVAAVARFDKPCSMIRRISMTCFT